MNAGKRIRWRGDMANAPQSGTVVADDGRWMTVKWDDSGTTKGRTERVPSALASSPRFSVEDEDASAEYWAGEERDYDPDEDRTP